MEIKNLRYTLEAIESGNIMPYSGVHFPILGRNIPMKNSEML